MIRVPPLKQSGLTPRWDICIVTGPADWWESVQRELGWRQVMQENGFTDLDPLIAGGDWTASSGEMALYRLMDQSPDIDAVFVSNDQMALGVIKAVKMAFGVKDTSPPAPPEGDRGV